MKSKMKKLVSLVLAMAMVLTMTIGMSATKVEAEENTCTITINGTTSGVKYTAYKLLNVTQSGTNYAYTINDTYSSVLSAALTTVSPGATDVVEYLSSLSSNTDEIQAFANAVYSEISKATSKGTENSDYYTITASDTTATISVAYGYYLIVEESAGSEGDSVSLVMLDTGDDDGATVNTKEDVPELIKKVQDINDSTDTEAGDWQDSADYDIDDSVPFQLTATMPDKISSYSKYSITFHDVMEDGLTFESNSVVVSVGGVEVDSSYYKVLVKGTDTLSDTDCTFEIVIDDVKTLKSTSNGDITVSAGTKIVVNYTAKLNDDAVIGNPGNWNTAYLEYSNNPYSQGDGDTSTTPKDTVVVLTYDFTINKVDGDGKALAGATFELYKYDATEKDWVYKKLVKNSEGTSFSISGLDDGVYKIVETEAPAGYNAIDDIYFIVSAEHDETIETATTTPLSDGDLTYTKATWDESTKTATAIAGNTDITVTLIPASGETLAATKVVNQSGSILPSTGGIGTTIFYIVGAILVLGAGVILVTRRRTRA